MPRSESVLKTTLQNPVMPISSFGSERMRTVFRPLIAMTALAALMVLPRPVAAGPDGGSVVAGQAAISQAGSVTTINQSTPKAIINWQGFSINAHETVNFNQPSSSAATLNRVIGNEASVIAGALNANGQVFLVNSAGVLFTHGAQVNVGGLVASTLDIANTDFMAGKYTFSGTSSASVINRGHILAHEGGYVALLGKTVSNEGVITATLGTVAMASGEKITLNFDGNSLIDVTIDKGTLNALVQNKRAIQADGGRVILTAKAADAVLSAQVNNSGIIQARTMADLKGGQATSGSTGGSVHVGTIKLLAQGGTTKVAGKLDVSAPNQGNGGSIETGANKVQVASKATIITKAASGQDGTWLISPKDFTIMLSGDVTGTQLASSNITIRPASGGGIHFGVNTTLADLGHEPDNMYISFFGDSGLHTAIGSTRGIIRDIRLESVDFWSSTIPTAPITGSYPTGTVTVPGGVGGLVGSIGSTTITGSYPTGIMTGSGSVGNLMWYSGTARDIIYSYPTGNLTNSGSVGGLVGYTDAPISNVYLTGGVISSGSSIYGLAGYTSGIITNSYATVNLTNSGSVSGLVGYNTGAPIGSVYLPGIVPAPVSNVSGG
ncbi:filamentous hemagglutinin N-terminal domain-containing protein [Beijerinckia indica]|uniref:Filamentous haemagglutinin family outer membrane protein n=1 Tax=Beijerinckia indica subsp. indica (strain ATCC 9039 / DSM 1715 / NCIMB 8712) TaxID=395963 RepID=B2IBX7_BEII9|nr:filamentous hemagglutinin N-terminal domain-containing protein [Beijerinckia indica]ACB95235.1 filamentous haemagglutinin family outer membrane protein [Beijerinckia indica subsp. indica ATCC 9039]